MEDEMTPVEPLILKLAGRLEPDAAAQVQVYVPLLPPVAVKADDAYAVPGYAVCRIGAVTLTPALR